MRCMDPAPSLLLVHALHSSSEPASSQSHPVTDGKIASLEWRAVLESSGLGSSEHLPGRRDESGQGGRSWFRRQQAYMKISHNYSVLKHLGGCGVWAHARWNGHFLGENGRGIYPVAPRCQHCGNKRSASTSLWLMGKAWLCRRENQR